MIRGIIYKYTSPNGKVYIGQTINESKRKNTHRQNAINDVKGYFHNALRKYGFYSFKYEVLFEVKSKDRGRVFCILDALERFYIRKYDSRNEAKGYNIAEGGEGSKGFHHTEEHKQKLREQFYSSRLNSPEIKEKARQINIARCSKKCYQYSLDGTFIKEYPSVAEATRQTGINNIQAVCKGNRKKAGGYYWSYIKDDIRK